jgi:hypothetical protein
MTRVKDVIVYFALCFIYLSLTQEFMFKGLKQKSICVSGHRVPLSVKSSEYLLLKRKGGDEHRPCSQLKGKKGNMFKELGTLDTAIVCVLDGRGIEFCSRQRQEVFSVPHSVKTG